MSGLLKPHDFTAPTDPDTGASLGAAVAEHIGLHAIAYRLGLSTPTVVRLHRKEGLLLYRYRLPRTGPWRRHWAWATTGELINLWLLGKCKADRALIPLGASKTANRPAEEARGPLALQRAASRLVGRLTDLEQRVEIGDESDPDAGPSADEAKAFLVSILEPATDTTRQRLAADVGNPLARAVPLTLEPTEAP